LVFVTDEDEEEFIEDEEQEEEVSTEGKEEGKTSTHLLCTKCRTRFRVTLGLIPRIMFSFSLEKKTIKKNQNPCMSK
jgi:hypothetical protein